MDNELKEFLEAMETRLKDELGNKINALEEDINILQERTHIADERFFTHDRKIKKLQKREA